MGIKKVVSKESGFSGPVIQIYLDKFGLGGDKKKLVFEHKANS